MTRGQIKSNIRDNLADSGVVGYSEDDVNESFQDAYDDICALTQCIVKETTIPWISELSYYDFKGSFGVSDYLATTAIFNNVTNLYLEDGLTVRDFDRIRMDWENWVGTPQFWAPVSPSKIAITAKYLGTGLVGAFNPFAFSSALYIGTLNALGTFNLIYAATAPVLSSDSQSPLISTDAQDLFENYCTADLIEQYSEFTKAQDFWKDYYDGIESYAKRVKMISRSDLLLRL